MVDKSADGSIKIKPSDTKITNIKLLKAASWQSSFLCFRSSSVDCHHTLCYISSESVQNAAKDPSFHFTRRLTFLVFYHCICYVQYASSGNVLYFESLGFFQTIPSHLSLCVLVSRMAGSPIYDLLRTTYFLYFCACIIFVCVSESLCLIYPLYGVTIC